MECELFGPWTCTQLHQVDRKEVTVTTPFLALDEIREMLKLCGFIALYVLVLGGCLNVNGTKISTSEQLAVEAEFLASLFAIPIEARSRHPRSNILEFNVKDDTISVLMESAQPDRYAPRLELWTKDLTVSGLLSSSFPQTLLKRSSLSPNKAQSQPCAMKNVAGEPLSGDLPLLSVFQTVGEGLTLECAVSHPSLIQMHDANAVYSFKTFGSLFPGNVKDDAHVAQLMDELRLKMKNTPIKPRSIISQRITQLQDKIDHSFIQQHSTISEQIEQTPTFTPELATPDVAKLYPTQGVDFSSGLKWAVEAVEAAQATGAIRAYPTWNDFGLSGRFDASTGATIARGAAPTKQTTPLRFQLAADWASGTVEADYVGQLMSREGGAPDWTLSAGDVYWTGTRDNVYETCLGRKSKTSQRGVSWPHGSKGSFAVLGNHEMYNRGDAFFDLLLPTLGTKQVQQKAGYASLETDTWRILMLDTGFGSFMKWGTNQPPEKTDMPTKIYDWLRTELNIGNPSDKRGILIITHHQPATAFETPFLLPAQGLAKLLPPNRRFFWLFGHEHKLSFYDLSTVTVGSSSVSYYGRCIGNSGFPTNLVPNAGVTQPPGSGALLGYDTRVYQTLSLPVDPDKVHGDDGMAKSFNGFVELILDQGELSVNYRTLRLENGYATNKASDIFASESFKVDSNGDVYQSKKLSFPFGSRAVVVQDRGSGSGFWSKVKSEAKLVGAAIALNTKVALGLKFKQTQPTLEPAQN